MCHHHERADAERGRAHEPVDEFAYEAEVRDERAAFDDLELEPDLDLESEEEPEPTPTADD